MSSRRIPVVDIHAHVLVPEVETLAAGREGYLAEQEAHLRLFGERSSEHNRRLFAEEWLLPLTDVGTRLGLMDEAGVDVQAVSVVPTQYHYWAEPAVAANIGDAVNEHIAALVAAHPQRLVGLATVALQHPDLAADQLRRAVRRLGLIGVEISTNAGGKDFSDPALEPFWASAEELGALVFVHPWGCTMGERLASFYLANIVGQPAETTVALSHLIFGGVLDKHPGLRICAAHGGGYLPYYLGRADHAYEFRPESREMARRPSAYLADLWFDSLVYRPDTLRQLVAVAGADRILLGTDYPFDMGVGDPLSRLDAMADLSPEDRSAIAGGNAARLLDLTQPEPTRSPHARR
ncbi:MAG: amidohydrolase family protein [Streptosporangiales bacterium]|nr:amidohydrolase family protein [Streptosporangiales bacterium]